VATSADLFYRAQRVDPGSAVALMGLAVAYERNSEYPQSLEYLERRLHLEPDFGAARLRRALCQLRLEEPLRDEAIAELRELAGESEPVWIRSIAFQEHANLLQREGDDGAAEDLLRAGLEELPGDQQLMIQLAAILDGQRRRREADRVVVAIQPGNWQEDSPRNRYDRWTPPATEEERSNLREEMKRGLAPLQAALAASPPEESEP
jgi:tetratricopeptide (TPR) repeat protein